jgi:hypothetical protein
MGLSTRNAMAMTAWSVDVSHFERNSSTMTAAFHATTFHRRLTLRFRCAPAKRECRLEPIVRFHHGKISTGVPFGTALQISSISSSVTAIQP